MAPAVQSNELNPTQIDLINHSSGFAPQQSSTSPDQVDSDRDPCGSDYKAIHKRMLAMVENFVNEDLLNFSFNGSNIGDFPDSRLFTGDDPSQAAIKHWKETLAHFLVSMQELETVTGINGKALHKSITVAYAVCFPQMNRTLSFWNWCQRQWATEFRERSRNNTLPTFEEMDLDPSPSNLDLLNEDHREETSLDTQGWNLNNEAAVSSQYSTPRKKATNLLGRMAQFSAFKRKQLRRPENGAEYKAMKLQYKTYQKQRVSKPANQRTQIQSMFNKIKKSLQVAERFGVSSNLWAVDASAVSKGLRPWRENHVSPYGQAYIDVLDKSGHGFERFMHTSNVSSTLEQLGRDGLDINGLFDRFNPCRQETPTPIPDPDANGEQITTPPGRDRQVYEQINIRNTRSSRRQIRLSPLPQLLQDVPDEQLSTSERTKLLRRQILDIIEEEATKEKEAQWEASTRHLMLGQRHERNHTVVVSKMPEAGKFDAFLQKYNIGLYLRLTYEPGFHRADILNLTRLSRRSGGGQLVKNIAAALQDGHIRVARQNPFDINDIVEGPDRNISR